MTMLIMAKVQSFDERTGLRNPYYNMFGYKSNLVVVDELNQFADAFADIVLPAMASVMTLTSYIDSIECYELNGTGYVTRTGAGVTQSGDRSGDPMPTFCAWGFQYLRANTGERSGSKRIGSISESDVTDGIASVAAGAILGDVADVLAAPLNFGIIQTWFPVILERPVAPSTVWGEHPIAGVTYRRVTTQNSRKN